MWTWKRSYGEHEARSMDSETSGMAHGRHCRAASGLGAEIRWRPAEILLTGRGMAKSDLPDELPSFWKKFWIRTGITLALVAALIVAGTMLYRRWEPGRLAGKARGYLEKGDFQSAILTARRALQINPAHQEASQVMADVTAKLQVPDAVDWRQRIAELKPDSTEAVFAWAQTALQLRRPADAEKALASVPEAQRGTARYHALAGVAALGAGRPGKAGPHFAEAVRLDPENELHHYNLAVFQIQAPDAETRKKGAETLDRLSRGGRVELLAKRTAIQQFIREKADAEALRVSSELQRLPGAEFPDWITHLDLLGRLQRPEFADFLREVQEKARGEKPENAGALINWMRINGRNDDALRWADSLDPKLAAHGRVGLARAECLIAKKDWSGMQAFLEKGEWIGMEPIRLGYLARAQREQSDHSGAGSRWAAALAAASRQREHLTQLALMASRWDWHAELRETLWAAAGLPAPQWALQMLHRLYLADGDTAALLRVAQRSAEVDAANDAAQNNIALLSLLLRRDTEQAMETARQLHAKAPGNAGFATTWALALHLAGRSAEGLQVLRALPPEKLREPSAAAYFGLLLAANGAKGEAAEFLALAQKAPLLPEEKALLATAH
jgi:tetratricopeptide (TPR) repeat protein